MKIQMPYTFHKWGVYTKEWLDNTIYSIKDMPYKIKEAYINFPRLLIYDSTDKKRNRKILRNDFRKKGIPFNAYCLNGGKPEDALCMCRFGLFFWQCYYVERGKKWDTRIFLTQSQACFYLYYSVLMNYERKVDFTITERKVLNKFQYEAKGFQKIMGLS